MHKHLPQLLVIAIIALQIPYLSTSIAIISVIFSVAAVSFITIMTIDTPESFDTSFAHKFINTHTFSSYIIGMTITATMLSTLFFFDYETLAIIYGLAATVLYCYVIPFILRHK